jgi:hypothetical protein
MLSERTGTDDTVDQRLASPVLNMRSPQIIEVNVSAGAGGKIVGGLRAAMQHHNERNVFCGRCIPAWGTVVQRPAEVCVASSATECEG